LESGSSRRKEKDRNLNDQEGIQQTIDAGAFCFLKQKGTVFIRDLLAKKAKNLVHEHSDLSIQPISMDPLI
jgi:hypothetical protein